MAVDSRPHYSGAPAETRKQLVKAWPSILESVVSRVEQSSTREGIATGSLARRQMEIV